VLSPAVALVELVGLSASALELVVDGLGVFVGPGPGPGLGWRRWAALLAAVVAAGVVLVVSVDFVELGFVVRSVLVVLALVVGEVAFDV
jgi:hypothetical protein